MANEKNADVVRRFIEDVANGRDTDAVRDLLAEDFRLPPGPDGLDRPGLVAVLEYYFAAFPDLHYEIADLVSDGDKVVARVVMTGTHEGDYAGAPGTGKTFVVDEVDIFDVHDGRITGYRIVWNEWGSDASSDSPSPDRSELAIRVRVSRPASVRVGGR